MYEGFNSEVIFNSFIGPVDTSEDLQAYYDSVNLPNPSGLATSYL